MVWQLLKVQIGFTNHLKSLTKFVLVTAEIVPSEKFTQKAYEGMGLG